MRRENSKREGCRWKMEGLQFTSTKTNWNTREINHHHLPRSLPPFDSISPHLHVPMELAAIFHPRGRPNSTGLYVWYTWGQTFPGKHIQLPLKKKQVTLESKYSGLVLVSSTLLQLPPTFGLMVFSVHSQTYWKPSSWLNWYYSWDIWKTQSRPCTTQKRTCTRYLSISLVLE